MGIFNRKKEDLIQQPKEPEGNANLAKQLGQSQVHIEKPTTPVEEKPQTPEQIAQKKYEPISAPAQTTSQGKPFYQFQTTPTAHGKRKKGWYIGMSIFFTAIVILNIFLGLYMSAIVIVLLATLIFIGASREPKNILVAMYSNGILVADQFYPWSEFKKFWILYEPPDLKQLHLKRTAKIVSELVIELGDQHPLKIRDLLLPLLAEDKTKEESRVDLVSRTLKL